MAQHSEKDWITLLKKYPNQTLKTIYTTYRDDCLRWIDKHFNCSQEEAEDFFQDAVIILFENVKEGRLEELTSQLNTYLYTIVKYQILKQQRKRKVDTVRVPEMIENLAQNWVENEEEEENLNDRVKLLVAMLQKLQDPCKTILQAFYFKKMNMTQIAELLQYKSKDVVKAQKYRCMTRLFKLLKNKQ